MKDLEYFVKLGKEDFGLTGNELLSWCTKQCDREYEVRLKELANEEARETREHELKLKECEFKIKELHVREKELQIRLVGEQTVDTESLDSNPDSGIVSPTQNHVKPYKSVEGDNKHRGKYNFKGVKDRGNAFFGRGGHNMIQNVGFNDQSKLKCFNCCEFGHIARNCALKEKIYCQLCDKQGHGARECHKRKGTGIDASRMGMFSDDVTCWNCNEQGHYRRQCPKLCIEDLSCGSCGGHDHYRLECPVAKNTICMFDGCNDKCSSFNFCIKHCGYWDAIVGELSRDRLHELIRLGVFKR